MSSFNKRKLTAYYVPDTVIISGDCIVPVITTGSETLERSHPSRPDRNEHLDNWQSRMAQSCATHGGQEWRKPGKDQPWEERASPLRKLSKQGGDRSRVKRHVTFPQGRVGGGALLYNRLSFPYLLPNTPINFRGRRECDAQVANRSRRRQWGKEAGFAVGSTQRGKWAGSPREGGTRPGVGGTEEVNGSAGSPGTKRVDSGGARAQGLPRFS